MLPGARGATGELYVVNAAPPVPVFDGGIRVGPSGAIYVDESSAPEFFVNGMGVTAVGCLCVSYGGTVASYIDGLPMTAGGRLLVQLNQPVSTGDAYVGGIRVGPLGGVYVVDIDPPVTFAFSNGFSTGFDTEAANS